MKIVGEIKNIYRETIKEHFASAAVFMLAMLIYAVNCGGTFNRFYNGILGDILNGSAFSLIGLSLGILLCEAFYLYKKNSDSQYKPFNAKTTALYIIASLVSVLAFGQNYLVVNTDFVKEYLGDKSTLYTGLSADIFVFTLITLLCLSVFFFYKRSNENFEGYAAKAFCSLMKAELVYAIIAIGSALIVFAFDELIFDTYRLNLSEKVQILLIGLVQFPCAVMALSRTKDSISQFGKIVLTYVLTILESIAFVIIYVYIIKILITWKFPSNEAFSILTGLFAAGIMIWTMALGCSQGFIRKYIRIMPFIYIPFIILQGMCLYMRVSEYGFTKSRYMGLALIVFEIVYFGIYTYRFFSEKDIISSVLFVIIIAAFIMLFFPKINMYSVVTASQRAVIEKCFKLGDDADNTLKSRAYEAFHAIKKDGGFAGNKYLEKKLSDEQIDILRSYSDISDDSSSDTFYVYSDRNVDKIDVSDYDELYYINKNYGSFYDESLDLNYDLEMFPLYNGDEVIGIVNLKPLADKFIELDKKDLSMESEHASELINEPVELMDGGILIISGLDIRGDYYDADCIKYIDLRGYVLK